MDQLREEFSEFLKSLNSTGVESLLIGGVAVSYHGYPRVTEDLDVWVAINPRNAERVVAGVKDFGFDVPGVGPELFLAERQVIRMGYKPVRIEILTTIEGVDFDECYAHRIVADIDGVPVPVISLQHLKLAKAASGRP